MLLALRFAAPCLRLTYIDRKKSSASQGLADGLYLSHLHCFSLFTARPHFCLGWAWSCFPYHIQVLPAPAPEAQGSTHWALAS